MEPHAPPPAEAPADGEHGHAAFSSYRRQDGLRIAKWLRARLNRYRLPQRVLEELRP